MKTLLLACFLPLLPVVQDGERLVLSLKDGRKATAEVLGVEDGKAHLKLFAFGGEAKVKRPLEDFTPVSAFQIEVQASQPATFEDHFALAKRAVELGLLPLAGKHGRMAADLLEADPDAEQKRAALDSWAADALEAVIAAAVEKRDHDEASEYLDILLTRFADQRTEEQLAAITQSVEDLENGLRQEREALVTQRLEEREQKKLEDRVAPVRAEFEKGNKELSAARSGAGSTSKAVNSCERAIQHYKAAWGMAQKIAQDYPDDDQIQQRVVEFGHDLQQDAIQAAMHAASILTSRSNYHGAEEWVNRVLAFDPENAQAQEMLKHIQLASASASSWRWGWGGARR